MLETKHPACPGANAYVPVLFPSTKSRFLLKFVWVPVRRSRDRRGLVWVPGSSAPGVKCAQNRALHRRSPLKERRRLRDFRCEAHFRQRDKVSGPIGTAARPKPIRTPLYNRRSRANGVNHCPDHFVLGLPGARESFQAGSFRKKVPIELAARTNCAWPRTASRAF